MACNGAGCASGDLKVLWAGKDEIKEGELPSLFLGTPPRSLQALFSLGFQLRVRYPTLPSSTATAKHRNPHKQAVQRNRCPWNVLLCLADAPCLPDHSWAWAPAPGIGQSRFLLLAAVRRSSLGFSPGHCVHSLLPCVPSPGVCAHITLTNSMQHKSFERDASVVLDRRFSQDSLVANFLKRPCRVV